MWAMNEIFSRMFILLFYIHHEYGQVVFYDCMIEEVNKMKELVKKCGFFNVNYGKGIVFQKKFKNIFYFMEKGGYLEYNCGRIKEVSIERKLGICALYDILIDRLLLELYEIRRELLLRNIYIC